MEQTQTMKPEKKCSGCIHHRENDIPERPDLNYLLHCEARSTYVIDEFAKKCFMYDPSREVMSSK